MKHPEVDLKGAIKLLLKVEKGLGGSSYALMQKALEKLGANQVTEIPDSYRRLRKALATLDESVSLDQASKALDAYHLDIGDLPKPEDWNYQVLDHLLDTNGTPITDNELIAKKDLVYVMKKVIETAESRDDEILDDKPVEDNSVLGAYLEGKELYRQEAAFVSAPQETAVQSVYDEYLSLLPEEDVSHRDLRRLLTSVCVDNEATIAIEIPTPHARWIEKKLNQARASGELTMMLQGGDKATYDSNSAKRYVVNFIHQNLETPIPQSLEASLDVPK